MMKRGEYYIGDLCYAIQHSTKSPDGVDNWSRVCDIICSNLPDGEHKQFFPLKDIPEAFAQVHFACYSTKYGDGEYNGFSVDSGTIGCVSIADLEKIETVDRVQLSSLGSIVNFREDFQTFSTEEGDIYIGNVLIPTGDVEEDDDYYSEDDADYEDEDSDPHDDDHYNESEDNILRRQH